MDYVGNIQCNIIS